MLARSLDAADRTREALEEAEKAVKLSGNRSPYSAHFGYALAREGNRNAALGIIDELHEQEHGSYVSPYDFALIYAGLGEADAAFGWLEKACIERAPRVRADLWDSPFCGLRSDARLHNILRRIGLPAASQSNA
jgi:tetratricopeptide (TPR) repeat protein